MEIQINIVDQILIFAIFALSLNLLMGYAGQVSIAHAALGAVGGYGAAYLAVYNHLSFFPSVLAGMALACLLGTLISVPALRLTTPFLILLTLALGTGLLALIVSLKQFGGPYGISHIPTMAIFGRTLGLPSEQLPLLLVLTGIVWVLCWRLGESPFGRVLKGIREDEVATRALGKNVFAYKVAVFSITAAMAGLGGALLVYYNQLVTPGQFDFNRVTVMVTMVIVGGMGNLLGSMIGVVVIMVADPLLENLIHLQPDQVGLVRMLAYGLILVIVMRVRPTGLFPEGTSLRGLFGQVWRPGGRTAALTPALATSQETSPADAVNSATVLGIEHAPAGNPLSSTLASLSSAPLMSSGQGPGKNPSGQGGQRQAVVVRGISKDFGGIRAVDNLDFEMETGRITALVGPNGAGKTTVFNLLTGAFRPQQGSVHLWDQEITGLPPHRVAGLGMVRTFQDVRLLPRLTAVENVMLAVQGQVGENLVGLFGRPWLTVREEKRTREKAMACLEFVSLTGKAAFPAGGLGYGEQKLVSLARILATDAKVLLLDEPASGIDRGWLDPILDAIGQLRHAGKTICIVEHNLHVVDRLADKVYFMEAGRVTAAGTMQELVSQERLADVYFGNV